MSATAELWRQKVESEHAQSESVRESGGAPADSWVPYAGRFRPSLDARDPMVERLLRELEPHQSVLDVGAGGGRVALPVSLHCRRVVAVEPSASMGAVLQEEATRLGRDNVSLIASTWEDAEVEPADVVVCVQVLYTVRDIEGFIGKLEAHARERVLVVLGEYPPYTQSNPLWPLVHGEARLDLPSFRDLMSVLWQMGLNPDLEMLPPQEPRGLDSREQALEQTRSRLFVEAGGEGERRLAQALDEMLEECKDGRFRIRGAPVFRPALVSWRPRA